VADDMSPHHDSTDSADQVDDVDAPVGPEPLTDNPEVPEADAWEQAQEVPLDEEDAALD
jgi:hypothetical protein